MSEFRARVDWTRHDPDFHVDTYRRDHQIAYGSGLVAAASSAPEYKGAADRLNPEEALVGALSSCHMLTFLAIAARKRLVVDAYEDEASGVLGKNDEGRLSMTEVWLRPRVRFAPGAGVDGEALDALHQAAHRNCFIAQSVKTKVHIEVQPA